MARCLDCMQIFDSQYEVCPHCGYVIDTPPKVAYHLYPGTVLAERYTIGKVIGYGGFGIVYKAWDSRLCSTVAIKENYPTGLVNRIPKTSEIIVLSGEKETHYALLRTRFLEEARIMAKLSSHPNIAHVHNFFKENNTAYIVMEYLRGVTLKQFVLQRGENRIEIDTAVQIVTDVSRILEEMHKLGIVHRDISLDNIHICPDGSVKIYDLGSARFFKGDTTQELSIVIKPGFAPPEQYRSQAKQGSWTDVYALAATLYRVITGTMPIESTERLSNDSLAIPSSLNPSIPEWLDRTILAGMAVDPQLRTQTMSRFRQGLEKQSDKLKIPEEIIASRKRKRSLLGIVAMLFLLITAGITFTAYHHVKGNFVPDGSIQMWIPVSDTQDSSTAEQEAYESAAAAFQEAYKGKQVDLHFIPASSYKKSLEKQASSGLLPDIYLYQGNQENQTGIEFWNRSNSSACFFVSDQWKALNAKGAIPLSFDITVLYSNTYLTGNSNPSTGESVPPVSLSKQVDALLPDYLLSADAAGVDILKKHLTPSVTAKEDFLQEKSPFYIGRSSEASEIQSALAGYCTISGLEYEGKTLGCFSNIYTIRSDISSSQMGIAELWLNYLLSAEGQDILFVQHPSHIPLNQEAFELFLSVKPSFSYLTLSDTDLDTAN